MIDVAAEFCTWTEQRHNGSSISSLGLAETSEVPNTILKKKLSQLSDGPLDVSKRLAVCELRQSETQPVTEPIILTDHTFLYKIGFWRNFSMITLETSYMKDVSNELSFLLVAHMTCFDIWFDRYGFLKSGFSTRQILDRLGIQVLGQVFRAQEE
jgi:hypothetical protein